MKNSLTTLASILSAIAVSSNLITYPFSAAYSELEKTNVQENIVAGIEKRILEVIENMKGGMFDPNISLQQDAETSELERILPEKAKDQYENVIKQGYSKSCLLKKEDKNGFLLGIAYKTTDKALEMGSVILFPFSKEGKLDKSEFFFYDRQNAKEFRRRFYTLNPTDQTYGNIEYLVSENRLQAYADALEFMKNLKLKAK